MNKYNIDKLEFYEKHSKENSPKIKESTDNNVITKQVIFNDGAVWYEKHSNLTGKTTFEVDDEILKIEVVLNKLEYWNTDDATVRIKYECC